ncbi:hypothetical protein PR002_g21210 [Phytophthora rubi]|uniref:Uncharacterized protein n=1 Tax=Phytophthora rubi TaxID=129364 RepID=A0A6A3J7A9_9STRA|nr:hypothetical protein PR002_g21210 [Phytophthora rubi]
MICRGTSSLETQPAIASSRARIHRCILSAHCYTSLSSGFTGQQVAWKARWQLGLLRERWTAGFVVR